jgi:hypothetical protein
MDNDLYYHSRENRFMEILDPPLWFQDYSIYKTAWCQGWVALLLFNPRFSHRQLNTDDIYQSILYEWELHHYPNRKQGILVPPPPTLSQLEDAVKYFYYKKVVIDSVIPSSRQFKNQAINQQAKLMLPPPERWQQHKAGLLEKVSHEIKKQIINLLS